MIIKSIRYLILFSGIFLFAGCLRKPVRFPAQEKVTLQPNASIRDILRSAPASGAPVRLADDRTIFCVVRADDSSGNFYQQLILEDSTGGLCLLLHANSLYRSFPAGSAVYLKSGGLYLGNSHGTLQLGGYPAPDNKGVLQVSAVPASEIATLLFPAKDFWTLPATVVNLSEACKHPGEYSNRLLEIPDVEWEDPLRDERFSGNTTSTNTILQNCIGEKIAVRTSNYATFRSALLPFGSGTICGIFSVYEDEPQLQIRDLRDIRMNGKRCDGSSGQTPVPVTIDELRRCYIGKDTTLGAVLLRAVVTSDAAHGNFGMGNIVVQQGGKGLTLFLGTTASDLPECGDSISIYLKDAILTRYNGLLEIKNLNSSRLKVVAHGVDPEIITLTIAQLNERFDELESVLVRIASARVTSAGKYGGSKLLSDGSGTVTLYTSTTASFADDPIPSISKTYQGIVTPYGSTREIKIRYPALDVY